LLDRIPDLASCWAEQAPRRPLVRGAIVWSRDEFYAASEALAALVTERSPRPPSAPLGAGEGHLFEAAGCGERYRRLALWFDERYQVHPPQVALLHLDRFIAIWSFLQAHGERLEREGLLTSDEEGMYVDEHMLTALVGVDYRPSFLDPLHGCGIGRYAGVLALTRAVESGRVRVIEFVRTRPGGIGANETRDWGEEGTPEDSAEAAAFELEDFEDAMEEWYRLDERPESELRAEAALFWSRVDDVDDPLEGSPALTLLLRWFGERYGAVYGVGGLFLRFMVMAGFIEQHLDRLVELGFLEPNGERYRLSGALFSALNNMALTPSPRGGAEPFDFDAVAAMARACRELAGDRVVAVRPTLAPRPATTTAIRRNEPCPCGSGRKFKRCCRRMMN